MLYQISDELIIKFALANGFKLKLQEDGTMALNPYVFNFVRAILAYLEEQNDNCCSCGHDWRAPSMSTPIPDDHVPGYMKRLGEWDTSKRVDMTGMFAPKTPEELKENSSSATFEEDEDPMQVRDFFNTWCNIANTPKVDLVPHNADLNAVENQITNAVDCSLVLIVRGDKFLGVSRKDNHDDIGLPGGKREEGESFEECAIREVMEETGYTITLRTERQYRGMDLGLYCVTFLADIDTSTRGEKQKGETGLVGFFDKQKFLDGSFGEYNAGMFEYFGM